MLLANIEREKELLRVFLKVSQMENKILRRMNLSSFLMVSYFASSFARFAKKKQVTFGIAVTAIHLFTYAQFLFILVTRCIIQNIAEHT